MNYIYDCFNISSSDEGIESDASDSFQPTSVIKAITYRNVLVLI